MATYEGMGLCSVAEYQNAFKLRLQKDQLTRGGLYVARFELKGSDRACRVLGRIGMEVSLIGNDALLALDLLSDDMEPFEGVPNLGMMQEGVWNPYDVIKFVHEDDTTNQIVNGCLRDHEDGTEIDDDMVRMMLGMPAHAQELELAGISGD